MTHLLQLSQTIFNTFPMINTIQLPIKDRHVLPIANQREDCLEKIDRDGRKFFGCIFPDCGKVFRYKSEFLRHKNTHIPEKSIYCPFMSCTKTFKREDALKSHLRTHTGETPYRCQEPGCEKKFTSRAGLKYHSQRHSGALNSSLLKYPEVILNKSQKMYTQTQWRAPQEIRVMYTTESRNNEDTFSEGSVASEIDFLKKFKEDDKIAEDLSDEELERMVKILVKENNEMKMKIHRYNEYTRSEGKDSESGYNLGFQSEKQSSLSSQDFLEERSSGFINFDNLENASLYQF